MAWQGSAPYYQDPNQQYPPNSGYPPNTGYPAQPGYPQGSYPQGGYPPGGYPPGGYPPQSGYQQPDYTPQPGFVQPPPMGGGYHDPEAADEDVKGFAFNDKSIRRAFIRKVYFILMIQLAITTAFIALFTLHRKARYFVQQNPSIFWVALGLMLVTFISMVCCESVRRKTPMNYIFLSLFTLAESLLLGTASARFEAQEVLMAAGITAAVCLGLTLFAFQTKWDFTVLGGALFACVIVIFIFGIFAIIFPSKIMSLVYSSLGALLFSVYLIYDTQLMLGGKHKYSISPEEYIFAALNLYIDIVQIFMHILSIIGTSRD